MHADYYSLMIMFLLRMGTAAKCQVILAQALSTFGHKYGSQSSSGQEPGEAFTAYGTSTVFVPLPQIATNSEKSLATNYTNSTKLFRVIREVRGEPFLESILQQGAS